MLYGLDNGSVPSASDASKDVEGVKPVGGEVQTDHEAVNRTTHLISGINERNVLQMEHHQYAYPRGDLKQFYPYSDGNNTNFDGDRITAFRIFVSKLAYEATCEDLEGYFKQFGNVTDTHIPRQPGNPALNKGYGFVSFDNEVDVIRVLQIPSHIILGREVMLDRATGQIYHNNPKGSEDLTDRCRDMHPRCRRRYDNSVPIDDRYYRRERDDHYRYYSYGSERGGYNSPICYSRSYSTYSGFDPHKPVNYVFSGSMRSHRYADMNYDDRYRSRATVSPKPRVRPVPKLFIGRLGPEITVHVLRSYFSQFGEIVDAYIPRDSYTQKSKGFGFLTYAHKDSIHAVMHPNMKHHLGGREIVVDYADMGSHRNR